MSRSKVPSAPVSVVIPAFNVEDYIGGAIASVRAQTVAPAEIIVIDDGSSDGTGAAAEEAGARVIRQINRGLAAARNRGVAAARWPWIALLDADDRWLPGKLERQWNAHLAAPDVRILATDLTCVNERGVRTPSANAVHPSYRRSLRERVTGESVRIGRASLSATLPRGQYVCMSSALIERALLLEEPFDPELPSTQLYHIGEDFEWLARAARHSDVVFVEAPLVEYLQRSGSLSSNEGRMRFGDVKLGEIVARSPERYAPGFAATFRTVRRRQQSIAALAFLRAAELSKARAVLDEASAQGFDLRLAALTLLVMLLDNATGAGVIQTLRSLRRAAAP
jgi:glycosyltransferase involved in cell wall biosynthesis